VFADFTSQCQVWATGFGITMAVLLVIYLAVQWWLLSNGHKDVWHKLHDAAERRRNAWWEARREKEAERRERSRAARRAGGLLLKTWLRKK
jgi:hypothetical protein